jgi:DNA-binding XRE family transcriptional regulator
MEFDIDTCQLRKTLSENIKQQRKILSLTQEKLAESADISPNMVNDIEGCRTWERTCPAIKTDYRPGI